jgi:hypothetical protein
LVAGTLVALAGVGVAVDRGHAASSCERPIEGATPDQQQVVEAVLCLMPGNVIQGVTFTAAPDPAAPSSLDASFAVPPFVEPYTSRSFLLNQRGEWEAAIGAVAIRDALRRRALGEVVGFTSQPALKRFSAIQPTPRTLSKGIGTWALIQKRVDAFGRKYDAQVVLHRYTPYGKAPFLEIRPRHPQRFYDGLVAVQSLFPQAPAIRFDGVMIVAYDRKGFVAMSQERATGSSHCASSGNAFSGWCHD